MRFATRYLKISVLVLGLASSSALQALLMHPLSIEELTQRAEVIVHGTVLSKSCQRDPQGRIFTQIELQVIDLWKGQLQQSPFTVVQAGGRLGEEQVLLEGQPAFNLGDEVVLFAALNSNKQGVVLGLAQGKFDLFLRNGQKFAQNIFHGPSTNASVQPKSTSLPGGPLPLQELKRRATSSLQ